MSALKRAETTWTDWRADGTIAGISTLIDDGNGRSIGLWHGAEGWGHDGRTVTAYAKGANGRLLFSVYLKPDDVRRLAASLVAMADSIDGNSVTNTLDALGQAANDLYEIADFADGEIAVMANAAYVSVVSALDRAKAQS